LGVPIVLAYFLAGLAGVSTMQPNGKWTVEFADNACVLSRRYGPEGDATYLNLKGPLLGTAYEVFIIEPKPKIANNKSFEEGWIERPDGSKATTIYASSYRTVDESRLTRLTINSDDYVIGQDGERLIVHLNKRQAYDFAMPGFKKAQAVLENCLSGLRDEHGVGVEVTSSIAKSPRPKRPVMSYFSVSDYPQEALAKGEQGYVGALAWVTSDGRVEDCKIIESSHRRTLDDRTCEVIRRRVRFDPGLDSRGKPIRSPYYQRIRWDMPD
jgi:TonB family protein